MFVDLWAHPDCYDPAVGTLRTYLTVLARHRAIDLVRSELRRIARQERDFRLTPAPPGRGRQRRGNGRGSRQPGPGRGQTLPAGQRQVVELAYFEGLTCREVANAVGIPEGTAKSRLRLALARLETVLDRQFLESS